MRIITNNIKNKNGRKSHTFHIRRRTTDERKWRCCVRGLFTRFVYLSRARAHYFSAHRLFIPVEWHSFHGPFMLCSIVVLHLLLIFYHSSAVQFFLNILDVFFFCFSPPSSIYSYLLSRFCWNFPHLLSVVIVGVVVWLVGLYTISFIPV